MYNGLAPFYDALTGDVNYEAFADFYEKIFELYGISPKLLLDLACGTGTITYLLADRGYEMIGVDASADMLSLAMEKAENSKAAVKPIFINQDMNELDLYGTVESVICCLDGINYVYPEDLDEAIYRAGLFLEPGGVFVFDINSPYKLRSLDGQMFADETEDVFCIWRAEFDEDENCCCYGMDIFSKEGRLWRRDTEEHYEFAYSPESLCKAMERAGFINIKVFGELTFDDPREDELRIFISGQKPS